MFYASKYKLFWAIPIKNYLGGGQMPIYFLFVGKVSKKVLTFLRDYRF